MKRAILITIKLLLVSFFLHNIGVFSFIANFEPEKAPTFKDYDGKKEDLRYMEDKMNRAKNLGGNYGPEEYFADLADIELKEKKKDFDAGVLTFMNSSKSYLHDIFHSNLMDKRARASKEEYNLYIERLGKAQDLYYEVTDPGFKKRQADFHAKISSMGYWLNLLLSFLNFLGKFYLKNFILAFFLLWFWWYQDKQKLKIDNPFSFVLCLIFYPVVIIRVLAKAIRQESRFFAMSIELRRREKNLFSLFSENEILELKRLAKSNMRLSDYRLYLDDKNLIYKHTLMPAVAVTFIFLFLPLSSQENNFDSNCSSIDFMEEICVSVNSPPNLIQTNFSFEDDQNDFFSPGVILEEFFVFFNNIFLNSIPFLVLPEQIGFKNIPKPIPLFVDKFLPIFLSNYFINKQWRNKNENFIDKCRIVFLGKHSFGSESKFGKLCIG